MYKEDEFLQLSGIQHFSFCRRQWALIHVENQWHENELTVSGHLVHEKVHNSSLTEKRGDTIIVRAMPIKSDYLGVSGECDAVEFTQSENGIHLHGRSGLWSMIPIEYKNGRSKTNDCDRLQAAAQAMCLEEMFGCPVTTAALFYHETRAREYITITSDMRENVKRAFTEMHELYRHKHTPKVRSSPQCSRCSLSDLCLPTLLKQRKDATSYIHCRIKEDAE